jgi:hypothetical protein
MSRQSHRTRRCRGCSWQRTTCSRVNWKVSIPNSPQNSLSLMKSGWKTPSKREKRLLAILKMSLLNRLIGLLSTWLSITIWTKGQWTRYPQTFTRIGPYCTRAIWNTRRISTWTGRKYWRIKRRLTDYNPTLRNSSRWATCQKGVFVPRCGKWIQMSTRSKC